MRVLKNQIRELSLYFIQMKNKVIRIAAVIRPVVFGFCFLLAGTTVLFAQEGTNAGGKEASGSGGSASYSVGQIVYTTHTGATGSVAQGVQQPYGISITIGPTETGINLDFSAYPNPTTTYLMLRVDDLNNTLSYKLYDNVGKLLESNTILANYTTIQMEQYPTAIYFLKVLKNNNALKTFKIIKN